MRYQELVQEKAELVRDIKALSEKSKGSKLTDDEKSSREEKLNRLEDVDYELKVQEKIQQAEREMDAVPDLNRDARVPAPDAPKADEPRKKFGSLGEMLQATYQASVPHSPRLDPRLMPAITGAPSAGPTGMGEVLGSDGGFLVDTQVEAGIEKRMYESGQILSRCRERPIGAAFNSYKTKLLDETSRADGSRWGGVRAYWTEEAGEITASKPKYEEFELRLQKLASSSSVT